LRDESKPKVILDTKPLIKLFAKEEGWKTVQEISSRIESGEIEGAIARAVNQRPSLRNRVWILDSGTLFVNRIRA